MGKLSKIPLVVQQKDILRDDSTLIYGNIHMFTRARFFLLKKKIVNGQFNSVSEEG